nr:DUF58 domain-containing protein [Agromyces seonyuensis]
MTGVRLEIPVGDGVVYRSLPPVPRGGVIDERLALPTDRRGVIPIGPVRTVRADPLGLVRREIVWSDTAVLHVHPRTLSIPSLGAGFRHDLEGVATSDLTTDDVAFHSLREYQQGDDRRFIHWRSSAKTGRFMVQQFEETRRSRIAVVLDAEPSGFAGAVEFELAVSVVGSLGVRAIRDGRTVDLWSSAPHPGDGGTGRPALLPSVTRERLLDSLCLVELDEGAVPPVDAARVAAESGGSVSLAFLVTGSERSSVQLRSAAGQFGPGVDVVVVECIPDVQPAVRSLGGVVVYTIGYLEDLRRMLVSGAAA